MLVITRIRLWNMGADVMKAVQSVHAANWVDIFLGLWTAALRLVNRVCSYDIQGLTGTVAKV